MLKIYYNYINLCTFSIRSVRERGQMSFNRFPRVRDCKQGYAVLALCCAGIVLAVFDHIVLGLPAWICMLLIVTDIILLQYTIQVITRKDREISLGDVLSKIFCAADRPVSTSWPDGPALITLTRVIKQAEGLRHNGFSIDLSNLEPNEHDAVVDYFDRVHHLSWKAAPNIPSRRRAIAQMSLNAEAWCTANDLLYLHDERTVTPRLHVV